MIAGSENSELNRVSVHAAAVGTVQIGEDDLAMILLKFGMQSTDSLIIQLNIVHFLTTDRDRRLQIAIDLASFETFEY